MNILIIDNYDSFTYNICQYLLEMHHNVDCYRNDKITIPEIEALNPDIIIISPGPKAPEDAGISLELVQYFAGKISIFGICLGHQTIGQAFGGKIVHAKEMFHGKTSCIHSLHKGIMHSLDDFVATRYHSLAVDRATLPDCLEITCETADGEIMGLKHRDYNIEGVQFHPESIMTPIGKELLATFIERTAQLQHRKEAADHFDHTPTFIDHLNPPQSFNETNIIDTMIIPQSIQLIDNEKDILTIFSSFYHRFGAKNVFLLDSAYGTTIDCNKNIIGVFPKFDIIIKHQTMTIQTDNEEIFALFVRNFNDIYQKEEQTFHLSADMRFSDLFCRLRKMFASPVNPEHHYTSGLVGYFSYEYLHQLEDIARNNIDDLALPDVHLTYYACLLHQQPQDKQITLIYNALDDHGEKELSEIIDCLQHTSQSEPTVQDGEHSNEFTLTVKQEDYFERVKKAKKYIEDGEIFQIQLGARMQAETSADSLTIYRALRRLNPSPYMFLWERDDCTLIGNSPELQLRAQDHYSLIRPIAGTSKGKGSNEEERKQKIKDLVDSEKEQAEHIMLVDLARNDIGRIAIPGTIVVEDIMKVTEFSHVFHLVTSVTGQFTEDTDTMRLFEATFPAGTLTGAPKVRAMEIIQELEEYERGPYGGSFGFFDFSGDILSTIIIRTLVKTKGHLYLQASAGIVADSCDVDEWNEIQYKTGAMRQVIDELNHNRAE